jgi:hypothetical protein
MVDNNNIITSENTLIILDWDNTLFPTSWLMKNKIDLRDPEVGNKHIVFFDELDSTLSQLLAKLLSFGKVVIVTNATLEWLDISSRVLPRTRHMFNKIKLVSARQRYRPKSNNMMDWKKMAFKEYILSDKKVWNIISIGDAEYEYRALIDLYNIKINNRPKLLKSIKLVDHPSNETLIDQLSVIHRASPDICLINKHLDKKFQFFSPYIY